MLSFLNLEATQHHYMQITCYVLLIVALNVNSTIGLPEHRPLVSPCCRADGAELP